MEAITTNIGNDRRWSLRGMLALVTGGTKGIGHAIVEELARLGAIVHTCARTEADLDACLLDWKAKGLPISGSICDVTSRPQREKLMETVSTIFNGKLNILVNNAGGVTRRATVDATPEYFSATMALNFESVYHLSQLAYPFFKASGQGNIVFISSIASIMAYDLGSVYGAAKGAMNQLARNLACEWAKDNIRVNSLVSGVIYTPLLKVRAHPWISTWRKTPKKKKKKKNHKTKFQFFKFFPLFLSLSLSLSLSFPSSQFLLSLSRSLSHSLMADIEPPSFSLGLDFDFEPSQPPENPEIIEKGQQKATIEEQNNEEEEEDEFNLRVSDSESDSPQKSTLTRLRRLRRGGPSFSSKPISTPTSSKPISNSIDDDEEDIEDFSDEDKNVVKNDHMAPHHQSSCSSSKLPLSGCGILMRQPESSTQNKKGKQDTSCPSTSLGSSKGKTVLSNLIASPLRKFQLLDSDSDHDDPSNGVQIDRKAGSVDCLKNNKREESEIQARFKLLDSESEPDDPSAGVWVDKKTSTVDSSRKNKPKKSEINERFRLIDSESDTDDPSDDLCINREASAVDKLANNKQKEANCRSNKMNLGGSTDPLSPTSQNQDLWKVFFANKKCSVPTPAFDEFCEEYFKTAIPSKPAPSSLKFCSVEQGISVNKGKKILQPQDSESVVPPSHHYFLHDDLRIQRLVRSRLPYFCPLSSCGDVGLESHNASSFIDYMSQFGQDGARRNTGRQVTAEKTTKRGRKKTKNSNIQDTSLGSGEWIDPKQTASTPKDAGRRRVHADGQSAGHWFTAENGMKVYVTKTGKELTGKLAYTQYRKESGKGFKKSRKKGAAKKK